MGKGKGVGPTICRFMECDGLITLWVVCWYGMDGGSGGSSLRMVLEWFPPFFFRDQEHTAHRPPLAPATRPHARHHDKATQ